MKRYLSLLMGILGFVPILAQQSEYYYYYKGERIDLTVDSTHLYVVSEGEFQPQSVSRASTEYSVSKSAKSYVYNNVVPLQKQRTATPEVYFSTLDVPEGTTAAQYDALVAKVRSEKDVWQVLPSCDIDSTAVTDQQIANGFSWAWQKGADIISCSWGFAETDVIDEAIDNALSLGRNNKGCVIVFASGNEGDSIVSYPARSDSRIIVVGGITPWGKRVPGDRQDLNYNYGFDSSYGQHLDVVAPSAILPTTSINNSTCES